MGDQMGRQRDGKAAFEYVLSQFPYYAWRSAVILGLDVGNFTLRQLTPEMVVPARSVLPAGSATERTLSVQDRDAWTLWQVEFQNYMQPTVAEQFTDGLMHLAREKTWWELQKFLPWKIEKRQKSKPSTRLLATDGLLAKPLSIS